jgi:hypothetical protein
MISEKERHMLRAYVRRSLKAFERRYAYDTNYMQAMVDLDLRGLLRIRGVTKFAGYRFGLPPGPYFAAKLVATQAADCGACLRLVIDMAAEEGVRPEDLAAILHPGPSDPDLLLAADFARAVLRQAPELPDLADEVTARWGERGRLGLAGAIAVGQFFPIFKRGLGHAGSCAVLPDAFRRQA